nr:transposase DDE domain protein [Sporomusa acidovorans DSM 3132]
MKQKNLLAPLADCLEDKRSSNQKIPFGILLILAVTAKLKLKTSLTDVPFAVTDAELLSELGWNVWDTERDLENGLFSENVMRRLIAKYDSDEFIAFYNRYVQEKLLPELRFQPTIHILDCTKIPVNLDNDNYEKAGIVQIDGETSRGYKLGALRGLLDDSGAVEEIVLGSIQTNDLELCREMLKNTACLKEQDVLINDRGFLSRDMMNLLKTERCVDTYIPAKKNMILYQEAVSLAKLSGKWSKHPNKKRTTQEIQRVCDLGEFWQSETPEQDVPINACVVHDTKDDTYAVFLTTDLYKTARQILQVYEIRPEIEEDFRQLKDFWKLEDFKSTQYNYITFHMVMTLLGYLYFQVYKNIDEGRKYRGKSLPVVLKNYKSKKAPAVIIYVGQYFGIFPFLEFIQLYAECSPEIRRRLDPILGQV